jgi:hypothetical protein
MPGQKKAAFTFRTLADILDGAFPTKVITKGQDENGTERWEFRVLSETYGKLICSFYPHHAEETYWQHFAKQMASSNEANLTDAALAFNKKFPGILHAQVKHAMQVLESVLPDIVERSIVLAGQIAIDRTLFNLDRITHRLHPTALASDGAMQLRETAMKIVRAHVHNPRGKRPRVITAKQIRNAYKKCGPRASRLTIAGELGISDTQLRTYYRKGERYSGFRLRHI